MTPVSAMQETLAAEHAALHVHGLLGARTSASAEPVLFAAISEAYRRHRSRRDQLRLLLVSAGAEPVSARVAYEVPDVLRTAADIRTAALTIEEDSTQTYAALVARTTTEVRRWAAVELAWSATWQVGLGSTAGVWPGAPELEPA